MKFFEIIDWFELPNRWHLGSPINRSGSTLDPRLFTEGKVYRGETVYPPVLESEMKDYSHEVPFKVPIQQGTKPLDFTFGSFNMPIVTETIAEQLEAIFADSIQLIPVNIEGVTRRFEILNVTKLLDAVNRDKSEISWRTRENNLGERIKTFAGVSRLVLKKEELTDVKIFRLKGWELPFMIDETVKEALENLRSSGIRFKEIPIE